MPSAAGDAFLALSGVKFSLVRYVVRIVPMILGLMLSLSYVLSRFRKSFSFSSATDGFHQSLMDLPDSSLPLAGFWSSTTQIASMTSLMAAGGLPSFLMYVMSASLIVSSADSASLRMGMATARSASHSSLIALAAAAFSCAFFSSWPTMAALGSTTSFFSRAIFSISASTSATVTTSCGCSATSSACMLATCSADDCSFSRPTV